MLLPLANGLLLEEIRDKAGPAVGSFMFHQPAALSWGGVAWLLEVLLPCSLVLIFVPNRLSGAAGSLLLAAPAESHVQPLLICMRVHRCQQAAARPPALTPLLWGWVLFLLMLLISKSCIGQVQNNSRIILFAEEALQMSVVGTWMLFGEGEGSSWYGSVSWWLKVLH